MGRSFFIVNSTKRGAERLQFRKMREALGHCSLCLEGPFADSKGLLVEIASEVRTRLAAASMDSPVMAAMLTLAPQNTDIREASWLKIPFLLAREVPCAELRDSAGAIASTSPVLEGPSAFRQVDPEDLDILGVAILRRLGVPCFYSFAHFDAGHPVVEIGRLTSDAEGVRLSTCVPCITLADGELPQMISMRPPFFMGSPSGIPMTALEVLDDDALLSIIKMKVAAASAESLMRDVAATEPAFEGEGFMRASSIGHTLHDSSVLWTPEDVSDARSLSAILLNEDTDGLLSARGIQEYRYVHEIMCPQHHLEKAASIILSDKAKVIAKQIDDWVLSGASLSENEITSILSQDESFARLMSYMRLAMTLGDHLHAASACPERTSAI